MRLFKVITFLLKSGEVYIYARFWCPPAYIEDIQFFGMNMSIILSSKAKKIYILWVDYDWWSHQWNIHFFASGDEINVIFKMTKNWISFLFYIQFWSITDCFALWCHIWSYMTTYMIANDVIFMITLCNVPTFQELELRKWKFQQTPTIS